MTRICTILLLVLICCCADRIVRNDIEDPVFTGGDYRCAAVVTPQVGLQSVCYPYTVSYTDSGAVKHLSFFVTSDKSVLTKASTRVIRPGEKGELFFTAPCTCKVVFHAVRQNGMVDTSSREFHVVNPYVIEVDSASLFLATMVKFYVRSTQMPSPFDSSLTIKWLEGESTKPRRFGDSLDVSISTKPYTINLSAQLSADGIDIPLEKVVVPVLRQRMPTVAVAQRQVYVPVNKPFSIIAKRTDADSLVWRMLRKRDTLSIASEQLLYTWNDTLPDTVIVTAKNRFGTFGNSDTVLIHPHSYRYELKFPPDFRDSIWARIPSEWRVGVTMNGIDATDTTICVNWNYNSNQLKPGVNVTGIPCRERRFGMKVNEPDQSFILTIQAVSDSGTSAPYERLITVRAHRPTLTVTAENDTITLGDRVRFTTEAFDTVNNGEVDSVFYRAGSGADTVKHIMTSKEITLMPTVAGNQRVSFWCLDNSGFSSDTVSVKVFVRSEEPYFIEEKIAKTVFVKDSVHIAVPAATNEKGDSIVEYRWTFYDTHPFTTRITSTDIIDTVFTESKTLQIGVQCTSKRGKHAADSAKVIVNISKGLPVVESVQWKNADTVFIGDSMRLNIVARDSNTTLSQVNILRGDSVIVKIIAMVPQIDTTVVFAAPVKAGVYEYSVAAIDEDNNHSATVAALPMGVHLGRPVIKAFTPKECWMRDNVHYTLSAIDTNGQVLAYYARWYPESSFVKLPDSIGVHAFAEPGLRVVGAYVVDNDGVASDTSTYQVTVKQGSPKIVAITADSASDKIYVNDTITFGVKGTDENDTQATLYISKDGGTTFEFSRQAALSAPIEYKRTFALADTGAQKIVFRLEDGDGNKVDSAITVQVKLGAPVVSAIDIDTGMANVFVNDTRKFTVKAEDVNGYLTRLYVHWNGDSIAQDSVVVEQGVRAGTFVFTHTYGVSEPGVHKVDVWAVDEDGVRSAVFGRSVTVRKGAPVVTKEDIDTFWVNDNDTVEFSAADTNGYIVKRLVDWNNDGRWDDSLNNTGVFIHAWDTTFGDKLVDFSIAAVDNDGIVSPVKKGHAYIKMGRPFVHHSAHIYPDSIQWVNGKNGDLDTMFYIYRGGDSYIFVGATDTNGYITDYEWDRKIDGVLDYTSNTPQQYRYVEPGKVDSIAVRAKDDDGIWSKWFKFDIYLDAPPPTTTTTTSQPGAPNVRVAWFGLDVKDDSLTQFAVAIDVDQNGAFADTVVSFAPANSSVFGKMSSYITYTFNPQEYGITGNFYFKVIARDARGSKPGTISPANVIYPY